MNYDRPTAGFTFIEMVVAVGLSLLIVGSILTNYNSYNDTQKLKQAALTLKNNLRFAQSQAAAGKKPQTGCTKLEGYSLTFTSASYTVQARCTEGLVGETMLTTLPSGVVFSQYPASLLFGVLAKGLAGDAVTIRLTGGTKTYSLQVSRGGDINDLGLQ